MADFFQLVSSLIISTKSSLIQIFTTSLIPYLENFIHLFHGCWIFCIRDDSFSTSLIPYFL